ncbi:MAG: DUF2892 domain-containing protein [Arachnia sp.]
MDLQPNEGTRDRKLRAVASILLAVAGATSERKGRKKLLLGLAALTGITAVTGYCPVYAAAGTNTLDASQ